MDLTGLADHEKKAYLSALKKQKKVFSSPVYYIIISLWKILDKQKRYIASLI